MTSRLLQDGLLEHREPRESDSCGPAFRKFRTAVTIRSTGDPNKNSEWTPTQEDRQNSSDTDAHLRILMISFDLAGQHSTPPLSQKKSPVAEEIIDDVESQDSQEITIGTTMSEHSTFSLCKAGERLTVAKKKARLRQLRLRVPTVSLGSIATFSAVLLVFLSERQSLRWLAANWMGCFAAYAWLLGLLPSDTRVLPRLGVFAFIPFFCLYFVYTMLAVRRQLQMVNADFCTIAQSNVPCWVLLAYTPLWITRSISALIVVVRVIHALKRRVSSRKLLATYWSSAGWFLMYLFFSGILLVLVCLVAGAIFVSIELLVNFAPYLIVGTLMLETRIWRTIQSWFLSRNESAVAAAGVAELLGGQDVNDVLGSARSNFKFVRADQVSFTDMQDNHPNPSLAAKTEKGHHGFVDAFVSHSWHDQPETKWDALQEFREHFKREHFREPTWWIDKYCIDQNNIDLSLACLPLYLAGCRHLWILCGPTYLERLWCIIEIYVFIVMGGQLSNLRVKVLDDIKERNDAHLAADRNVSKSAQMVSSFHPRKAKCFNESDTERLHRVIQGTGYDLIIDLVRDAFVGESGPLAQERGRHLSA